MRKITSIAFLFMVVLTVFAGPVSRNRAAQIAQDYLERNRVSRSAAQSADLSLAYECVPKTARSLGISNPLYYVFNEGKDGGFVVVAGDDRMTPVLGYVDEGSFALQGVNDNMKWWLQALEGTMLSVSQSESDRPQDFLKANHRLKSSVPPLIKSTWGQSSPYNDRCPVDNFHGGNRSLVGCVATASAQVLNYWQYPARAEGYVSYTTNRHQMYISENLSNFQFRWDQILPSYANGKGSYEQRDAVAELAYACGVAARMDYCANESSAVQGGTYLKKHFGIDPGCIALERVFFNRGDWDEIVRVELSEGRPVLYTGQSDNGGHAFICDGYNEEGLFHINWGWDGSMNGYFALAELNSAAEHAGAATDATNSYNYDQNIVIGIQPKVGAGSKPNHTLFYSSIRSTGEASRNLVPLVVDRVLANENGFNGVMAIGIYDQEGNYAGNIQKVVDVDLLPTYYTDFFTVSGSLPKNLRDGNYTLRPIAQLDGENLAYFMIGRQGAPYVSYLNMNVRGNAVSVSQPRYVKADLKVVSVKPLNEYCYAGANNPLEVVVRNEGAMYNGPIVLTRNENGRNLRVYSNNYILEQGEECTLRVKVRAPEYGNRDVLGMWMAESDDDNFYFNGYSYGFVQDIEYPLKSTTPGTPSLSVDEVVIQNPNVVLGEDLIVQSTISNQGGFFNGPITFFIFPSQGGNSLSYGNHEIFLDYGQSVTFTTKVPTAGIPEGEYGVLPYSGNICISNDWKYFSIVSAGSIKVDNDEGYGVFCSQRAFEVPWGMQCGVVTSADYENMKIDYRYQTGDVVPAGTPVIVNADAGEYAYYFADSNEFAPGDNLLRTQVDSEGYTYAGPGDYWYYGFGCRRGYVDYGFYAYTEDGGPFYLNYQECYLAMPAGYGAPSYPFKQATGIRDLVIDSDIEAGKPVYNISGVRMQGKLKDLPKGIYIVGGKKVLK